MSAALDKRLKAREFQVTAAGHVYTLRRPTAAQMARLADGSRLDMVRECVVAWNLTALDLYPGGDPTPAPFDADVWGDWLDDHADLWAPLADALVDAIQRHQARLEDAAKN